MHNDLISRSELLREIDAFMNRFADDTDRILVESFIRNARAIDAEPVRHGRWIYDPNANDWYIGGYVCSECHTKNNNLPCKEIGNTLMYAGSKFCPSCGAKMDGVTDGDNKQ